MLPPYLGSRDRSLNQGSHFALIFQRIAATRNAFPHGLHRSPGGIGPRFRVARLPAPNFIQTVSTATPRSDFNMINTPPLLTGATYVALLFAISGLWFGRR